jgi:hypothetical protein
MTSALHPRRGFFRRMFAARRRLKSNAAKNRKPDFWNAHAARKSAALFLLPYLSCGSNPMHHVRIIYQNPFKAIPLMVIIEIPSG